MLKKFTMVSAFGAADFEDLGEAGVINESLKNLFLDQVYEEDGREYPMTRIAQLEVKVVPELTQVLVLLYGEAEIAV